MIADVQGQLAAAETALRDAEAWYRNNAAAIGIALVNSGEPAEVLGFAQALAMSAAGDRISEPAVRRMCLDVAEALEAYARPLVARSAA